MKEEEDHSVVLLIPSLIKIKSAKELCKRGIFNYIIKIPTFFTILVSFSSLSQSPFLFFLINQMINKALDTGFSALSCI